MPAGQGHDAARFAAAVEAGNPGFPVDPALRRDLEIVGMLRSTGAAMAPSSAASARMKDRLFASIAADLLEAEPTPTSLPVAGPTAATRIPEPTKHMSGPTRRDPSRETAGKRPAKRPERLASVIPIGGGRHRIPNSAKPGSLARRFVLVSAAAAAMVIALSSTGVVLSQSALPGDALYTMKLSAESASLGLVFGDAEKAAKHLEFASNRLTEVEQMVAAAGSRRADPALVADTLRDFDSEARTGSRLVLSNADDSDPAQLGTLRQWADAQAKRLGAMLPALPATAQSDGDDSLTMLSRMQGRADAIRTRLACQEVLSGILDDLGPLPSSGRCTPPSDPASSRSRTPAVSPDSGSADPGLPDLPSLPIPDPGLGVPGIDAAPAAPPPVRVPLPGGQQFDLPPLLPGLPGLSLG